MKIILGDNQFFGVNHFDLQKAKKTKSKFESVKSIEKFIKNSLSLGMDGFMINSNFTGYKLLSKINFDNNKEIHYSIPYPHKYANMVNEKGMTSLLYYVVNNTSIIDIIKYGFMFLVTKNLKYLIKPVLNIEIPNNLPKGSYVYLQNVITDLILGMGKFDLIIEFINAVSKMDYKPGIITLNPLILQSYLNNYKKMRWMKQLIVCFNINKEGFNVFPKKSDVEEMTSSNQIYKKMGMSIFSSGGADIQESIKYIKTLNLDYVVFGSSKLENIEKNLTSFKSV